MDGWRFHREFRRAAWKARLYFGKLSAEILVHLTLLASKPRKATHKPRSFDRELFGNRESPLNGGRAVVLRSSFLFFLSNLIEGFNGSIDRSTVFARKPSARSHFTLDDLFTAVSGRGDATQERMLLTALIVDRSNARRQKEFELAACSSSGSFSAGARSGDFSSAPIGSSVTRDLSRRSHVPQRRERQHDSSLWKSSSFTDPLPCYGGKRRAPNSRGSSGKDWFIRREVRTHVFNWRCARVVAG